MDPIKYLSVCSGIEAATVAWHPLGWRPVAFSEIEKFPSAVLAHHYPAVPNWGDMTKFQEWPDATVDLLVGGTPCQSFSVAGLRQGLRDPRGNLALVYLALADRYRPRWLVWENVPGVLSSGKGRDFGSFLGGMAELGYGFAYRVLDAQHVRTRRFGRAVPQRRRRVFVVGYLGDWRRAAAVLFDRESLRGNPSPGRFAGQAVAALTANGVGTCGADDNQGQAGHLIAESRVAHSLRGEGFDASEDGTGRGTPLVPIAIQERAVSENPEAGPQGKGWQDGCAYTLEAGNKVQAVAFDCKGSQVQHDDTGSVPPLRAMGHAASHANAGGQLAVAFDLRGREGGSVPEGPHDTENIRAASGGSSRSYVAQPWAVRRLTPRECERLQGFPDDYTLIPYRRGLAADGPRYKALGNSMAVNVMEWIGERIAMVDAIEVRS